MAEKEELKVDPKQIMGWLDWVVKHKDKIWTVVVIIGGLLGYSWGSGNVDPRQLVPDSANVVKIEDRVSALEESVKLTNEIVKKLAENAE